jgi:hypothetical protein
MELYLHSHYMPALRDKEQFRLQTLQFLNKVYIGFIKFFILVQVPPQNFAPLLRSSCSEEVNNTNLSSCTCYENHSLSHVVEQNGRRTDGSN